MPRLHDHIYTPLLLLLIFSGIMLACSSDEPEEIDPETALLIEQNRWIYSRMKLDYLWNEEMPDSLACDYRQPVGPFFRSLLSSKDRFSYITSKDRSRSEGESRYAERYYGFAFQEVADPYGNHYLMVLYATSEQALRAGIERGTLLRVVSCTSASIEVEIMQRDGTEVTPTGRFAELEAESRGNHPKSVYLDSIYHVGGRNIGYICYLEYDDIQGLVPSMKKMHKGEIDDLILDLRFNPGGYVKTCKYLCNSIMPSTGYGGIYQKTRYNRRIGALNYAETGDSCLYNYFVTPGEFENEFGTTAYPLDLNRVIILTSKGTASASEANIICLQPFMEVITIGDVTVGKGQGMWGISHKDWWFMLEPITMQYYNALDRTVPSTGLVPDYSIPDGADIPYARIGRLEEPMLACAISLIVDGEPLLPTHDSRSGAFFTPVGEPSFATEFRHRER